jgi:hypothetical protein
MTANIGFILADLEVGYKLYCARFESRLQFELVFVSHGINPRSTQDEKAMTAWDLLFFFFFW